MSTIDATFNNSSNNLLNNTSIANNQLTQSRSMGKLISSLPKVLLLEIFIRAGNDAIASTCIQGQKLFQGILSDKRMTILFLAEQSIYDLQHKYKDRFDPEWIVTACQIKNCIRATLFYNPKVPTVTLSRMAEYFRKQQGFKALQDDTPFTLVLMTDKTHANSPYTWQDHGYVTDPKIEVPTFIPTAMLLECIEKQQELILPYNKMPFGSKSLHLKIQASDDEIFAKKRYELIDSAPEHKYCHVDDVFESAYDYPESIRSLPAYKQKHVATQYYLAPFISPMDN